MKIAYSFFFLIFSGVLLNHDLIAQSGNETGTASDDPNIFPELVFTSIKGAPKLSRPTLVTDGTHPLVSGGFGYAAPAYYDWDGDGLRDLLIGEFGSGAEFGRTVGNFIRVYLNVGTETQPAFTLNFDYARAPFKYKAEAHGTPYSVDQYCCIGFTPQFIDLNGDGYIDMFTGQYQGEVSWFKGSKEGFHAGEPLPQEGNPRSDDWAKNQPYWLYSSASFGDLTGDGKLDLIVGGQALRISKNIGTVDKPEFAQRELLLDVNGDPLKVYEYSQKDLEEIAKMEFVKPYQAGDYATSPHVLDWDDDGVLDLLVTNSYSHKGFSTIDFFRGVKKNLEHRFEPSVPLFISRDGNKALPGSAPFIFVTDWNKDGVKDILIGTGVTTVHNSFSGLSWYWNKENGVPVPGRGPASIRRRYNDENFRKIMALESPPLGISMDDFLTMDHNGFVYVMLGSKSDKNISEKTKKSK